LSHRREEEKGPTVGDFSVDYVYAQSLWEDSSYFALDCQLG
jgi:hypothetical protein